GQAETAHAQAVAALVLFDEVVPGEDVDEPGDGGLVHPEFVRELPQRGLGLASEDLQDVQRPVDRLDRPRRSGRLGAHAQNPSRGVRGAGTSRTTRALRMAQCIAPRATAWAEW